jgi:RNA polymerase sigma-70 factor (ECF subfamily)
MRLSDTQDQESWRQFVEIYAPLIHAYGLHHGLQDADGADLAQNVLQAIAAHAPRFQFDPSRGTFRGWLFTVTRNELLKIAARQRRQPGGSGDTHVQGLLQEQPDGRQSDAEWDREHRWRLFLWAAERVKGEFREATWRAFWLTAVEGQEIEQTARELEISVGAVYIARNRVTARIRREVETVEEPEGVP